MILNFRRLGDWNSAIAAVVVAVVVVFVAVTPVGCFLPHDVSTLMKRTVDSKHHGNITLEALAVTVDWFLRENEDIYPPQSHGRLKNSTAFRKAMNSFKSFVGKSDTLPPYMHDPSYHFTSEKFAESNRKLIQEREKVINSIKNNQFDAAWPSAGLLLHALQDFYSYSDWLELGNQVINEDLGTTSAFASYALASPDERTCINCPSAGECRYNIKEDIVSAGKLTSGYFSQHMVPKPEGKCGHGGTDDDFRDSDATGGINKATRSATLSPHYYLHDQAAALATEATVDMLRSIYQAVLENRESFGKFLGIEMLTSMCFIIDTTGSMGEEIADVKNLTIEMTREAEGSGKNFVLVPVNDPHPNLIYMTNSSSEMIRLLSGLTATGGGDAPEMSISGMLLAAQNVRFGSRCYVFTDAEAKDRDLIDTLKSVLTLRSVQMDFKLTTVMKKRRKKRSSRVRRALADDYKEIAEVSGGTITLVRKGELKKALEVVKVESKMSTVVVKMASQVGVPSFEFLVDSTMNETYIELITIGSSIKNVSLASPTGGVFRMDYVTKLPTNNLLKLTEPEPGRWNVTVQLPSSTVGYSYRIFCQTTIDFTYSFVSSKGVTLESLPIRGEEYYVSVQTYGPVNKDSLELLFYSPSGIILSSTRVNHTSSGTVARSVLPSTDDGFFVALQGTDENGKTFHRMDTNIVRTSLITLELALQPNETLEVKPDNRLSTAVRVINQGVVFDSWTVKIFDSDNYLQSPKSQVLKVPTNSSSDLTLTFSVPKGTRPGQVTTVSVMVTSNVDPRIKNTLVFYLAVIPEKSDLESPSCNVTEIVKDACSSWNAEQCLSHRWKAGVSAQDADSGLTVFKPDKAYNQSTFTRSNFTKGSTDIVTGVYEGTCCNTSVTVVAVDGNGNVGRCRLLVDPPKPVSSSASDIVEFLNLFKELVSVSISIIVARLQ